MNKLADMWSPIYQKLDPRPSLAQQWFESSQTYEPKLRANTHISQDIVDFLLQEKAHIETLFASRLPEYQGRVHVVVTGDVHAESCAVFSWQGDLFVLVSAALLGRPYDHPEADGRKAWEWLSSHEAAHIRGGHLPWFFYTRRLFLAMSWIYALLWLASFVVVNSTLTKLLSVGLYPLLGFWLIQTAVGLFLEWQADHVATHATSCAQVLEEAKKSLYRMTVEGPKAGANPWLRKIFYLISVTLHDPHPPYLFRRWLLDRRIRFLQCQKGG